MSQKRHPEEGTVAPDGSSPEEKRQRVPAFRGVVMEALRMDALQKLLTALEPLVRKVVKEEVELALANHVASMTQQCGKEMYSSTIRSLQLQFKNKLFLPIFTGTRIEGEDCSQLNIALVDALTGQVVMSGPESSMKVEIVVLEGDFEGGEENNWTFEEFKNNIVREREGKRPLLTGEVLLDLNGGIGIVGDLSFTDNSSWTRSRKFRLGARIVDGYFNGMRVREAKTEPFMVKDHRGELYKKHYPPSLWDEVWRLEKIGKDGAFHKRLSSESITTVKDFLTLLSTDAPRLRNILGSGMSAKMWEVTVEHARTCILTNQMHFYYPNSNQQTKTEAGVVFNVVGEVMGLVISQQYLSLSDLSEDQKADAHALVKLALEHWSDVVAYDMSTGSFSSHAPPNSFPSGNTAQSLPDLADDGRIGFTHQTTVSSSSPDLFIACTTSGVSDNAYAPLQDAQGMGSRYYEVQEPSHGLLGNRSRELLEERIANPLILDEYSGGVASHTFFEDSLQYLDSDGISLLSQSLGAAAESPADLETAVNGFLAMSARMAAARKANTVWGTLLSVLRWRFSIKKIVASKKKRIHQKGKFG